MKIIVERDALADALKIASHPIEAKPTIPIMGNVLLHAEQNSLSIRGSDLEVYAASKVVCETNGSGAPSATTIAGRVFATTIAGLPSGATVTLEWADSREVLMKAARSRYRFAALPASDFPEFIEPEGAVTFSMPAKEFALGLASTEFAVAKEVSRIYLCGVCLQIADPDGHGGLGGQRGPRLIFVATNSRELGFYGTELPVGAEAMPAVILPQRAVSEMARIAAAAQCEVELSISPKRAIMRCGGVTLATKLIDAKFPSYMSIIPADGYQQMVVDVQELDGALSRLANMGEATKAILSAESNTLKFELSDANGGAEEEIDVDWPHEPMKKRVNARSILAVLQRIKTDRCAIRFHEPRRPMLFNEYIGSKMETQRTFLSMPMEGS